MNPNKLFSIFVALILITGVSAQSVDLRDYKTVFIQGNAVNGKIVVGENAHIEDSIAALSLANNLAQREDTVFEPGESEKEDVNIGDQITNDLSQMLTDVDVEGLVDSTITFRGSEYDVSEEIILGQTGKNILIQSSLTSAEDDYQTDVVMEVDRDAIKYFYLFDESIDLTDVSRTDPLEIEVLGRPIKITEINSPTSFTAFIGNEYFMNVNDEVEVAGKTVKLVNVGSNGAIVISVDDVSETIPDDQTETVNGIEIANEETFYVDDISGRSASLIIGTDAIKTYADGDEFIDEDEDSPDWVWNIGNLETTGSSNPSATDDGTGPFIGVENDFVWNDESDSPPSAGDSIEFPFGYATIWFETLTIDESDYESYTIGYTDSVDLSDALGDGFTSEDSVLITTPLEEGLVIKSSLLSDPSISSDVRTDSIWLHGEDANNLNVLYLDRDSNDIVLAGTIDNDANVKFAEIDYQNTKGTDLNLMADFSPADSELVITLNPGVAEISGDNVVMTFGLVGNDIRTLGSTANEDEASEVTWNGVDIGTKDNDLRTKYGIVIKNPSSAGSDDEVELEIPADVVEATIVVYKEAQVVRDDVLDKAPEVVLDTAAEDDENLILVGGPAANRKTAELLGASYPAYGTSENFNVEQGEAMIKIIEENDVTYLIIAGYNKEDTTKAVNLMKNPQNYNELLSGKREIIINVGDLSIQG